jgi:hypothetical protein
METEEYGLAKVLKPHIDDDELLKRYFRAQG